MRGDTYHQLGEHGVQFFGGRHGHSGLQALQGEAAVVAEAVRDLGVVAPFEAAENDGGQAPPATLAGRHGNGWRQRELAGSRARKRYRRLPRLPGGGEEEAIR